MVAMMMVSVVAVPEEAYAAAKKSKVKVTIKVLNANSNTVIKKGKKLKLKYTYTKKNTNKKVKIKFKSSNKKVATVSKKGTIKAKKNGTAKITITAYVKGKKRGSKTVKIRVGKRVSGISISGYKYLRKGKSTTLKASISPSKAANKKVSWTSSNPSVVKVTSSGKITGVGHGSAVITATALDGSGVSKSTTVISHKFSVDEARWIAHRGLHEDATENTATAFRFAGLAGFWGCECDIWETRHVEKEIPNPDWKEDPEGTGTEGGEPSQDPSGDEPVIPETIIVEDFDIAVNHDETFNRVFGVNRSVNNMTAEEIRENPSLGEVCFFEEYLDICKQYDMVPIIEIKDYDMSDAGIEKTVTMVNEAGLLESAQFISFNSGVLARFRDHIVDNYGVEPYTGYLISSDVNDKIDLAIEKGFTGVNISYTLLTQSVNNRCKSAGLKVCTWTYKDTRASDEMLYKHVVSGDYDVYSATIDGKYF